MRHHLPRNVVVALAVLLGAAHAATISGRPWLREGPTTGSARLLELAPGTGVEVLEQSGGWRRIRTPDGQEGWVWREYLEAASESGATEPVTTGRGAEPETPSARRAKPRDERRAAVAEEVSAPAAEAETPRAGDASPAAGELDELRAEVENLTSAVQDLAVRLDDRTLLAPLPGDTTAESPLAVTAVIFVVGALFGGIVARVFHRRRERRQRYRLRL